MTPMQAEFEARSTARRLLSLQRDYRCAACEARHLSWGRLHHCPECGHRLSVAVIRRAAMVGTAD